MRLLLNTTLLCFLVILTGLTNCTEGHNHQDASMEGLPEDFVAFYQRFHQDSAFQLARIAFPLQGIPGPDNLDSTQTVQPWQREGWIIHKRISNIEDYDHTCDVLTNDLIVETIEQRDAPIAMQRRFARMASGWHLIYYVEMQPMSRKKIQ